MRGLVIRRTLVWWLVFSIAGGIWALATPQWTGPDEDSHGLRAYSAARGEWLLEREILPIPGFEVSGAYIHVDDVTASLASFTMWK